MSLRISCELYGELDMIASVHNRCKPVRTGEYELDFFKMHATDVSFRVKTFSSTVTVVYQSHKITSVKVSVEKIMGMMDTMDTSQWVHRIGSHRNRSPTGWPVRPTEIDRLDAGI